jgi:dihydrofolate synthase/folylpolyglutamate synthase
MSDKPAEEMLRVLGPLASALVTTEIPVARSASAGALRALAEALRGEAAADPDPGRALDLARRAAGPDGLVVATGSLYLVGEVRKIV